MKEKGEGLSETSNQMGCFPWFHLHLALWADKNHTSIHLSAMHGLPGVKAHSAAPTDEGIDVFSLTGQSSQPFFLAEPPPCSCCIADLGPWCLISGAFIPRVQMGSFI